MQMEGSRAVMNLGDGMHCNLAGKATLTFADLNGIQKLNRTPVEAE